MNTKAYAPNDPNKQLIDIEDWLIKHGHDDGRCKICNESVYVKAVRTQKQTHFSHYPKSKCPSVDKNHIPYKYLTNLPKDPALALAAKTWMKENINNVYEKLRNEFKHLNLRWTDLHQLIRKANTLDIWSLVDMPHEYIPYILLTCCDKFEKNDYRKNESYFVLEPSPNGISYWNENGRYKQEIWEVTLPNRNVVNHPLNLTIQEPWYIIKANELLDP